MKRTCAFWQILAITFVGSTPFALAQTQADDKTASPTNGAPTRLPEVTVVPTNTLLEDHLIGENQQPEWTARRRFVTTRVYVQPPWQVEAELGYDGSFGRVGKPLHRLQQEIEVGLPHRFQLDVENVVDNFKEGDDEGRKWHHDSNSVELRYALAEWGRIPLNPTVNAEWKFNDGAADAFEFQLLLGEEFSERLHWGLNLFYENQIGDDRIREFAASMAVSYTLIDEKLSAGIEMKFSSESDKDIRGHPENRFQIGPSIQWRPTRRTHLDVVPLFGAGPHGPTAELFVFFGIEFGPGSNEKEGIVPASLRGK
jgi:hypothetical protein